MKHIGITGTRFKMTGPQGRKLSRLLLAQYEPESALHHGACVGVDEYTATKASYLGYWVVAHLPIDDKWLSTQSIRVSNEVCKAKEYIDRNHDIVEASSVVIAVPNTKEEVLRSGTWSTIRYAKKLGKEIHIIFPSGETEVFEDTKV